MTPERHKLSEAASLRKLVLALEHVRPFFAMHPNRMTYGEANAALHHIDSAIDAGRAALNGEEHDKDV